MNTRVYKDHLIADGAIEVAPFPTVRPTLSFILPIISFFIKMILPMISAIILLGGCSANQDGGHTRWTLTQQQRDSIEFSAIHHYNVGYNFVVAEDSLLLLPSPKGMDFNLDYLRDTTALHYGDDFVVTDIFHVATPDSLTPDSIWLRVGTDGAPLGWVSEQTMLDSATPVDPISRFIHFFSGSHLILFYAVVSLLAVIIIHRLRHHRRIWMVHFHDVRSPYPTAFCISIATAAMLYATIQLFMPDTWVEFYFHPSLNPLGQPFILLLFLSFVWLSVVLLLSVVFDLKDKLSLPNLVGYFAGLLSWGGLIYIVTTVTIKVYVGYLIYIAYIIFAIVRYTAHNHLTIGKKHFPFFSND